jgi:hypothetical protein
MCESFYRAYVRRYLAHMFCLLRRVGNSWSCAARKTPGHCCLLTAMRWRIKIESDLNLENYLLTTYMGQRELTHAASWI